MSGDAVTVGSRWCWRADPNDTFTVLAVVDGAALIRFDGISDVAGLMVSRLKARAIPAAD